MPRDASGNYTLPAGNPVAPSTVIATTWANPTMSDIGQEITNSLDRQGRGGMLVPFQNVDGDIINPGITWTNEPSSGFYRAGVTDMRVSLAGIDQFRWIPGFAQAWNVADTVWNTVTDVGGDFGNVSGAWGFDQVLTMRAGARFTLGGTVTTEASVLGQEAYRLIAPIGGGIREIAFYDETNVNKNGRVLLNTTDNYYGLVSANAFDLNLFAAGADRIRIDGTTGAITFGGATNFGPQILLGSGSAAVPSLGFTDNPDIGLYLQATNVMGVSINGADVFRWGATVCSYRSGYEIRMYDSATNSLYGSFVRQTDSFNITTSDGLAVRLVAPVEVRASNTFRVMNGANTGFLQMQSSGDTTFTFTNQVNWVIGGLTGVMQFPSVCKGITLGVTGNTGQTLAYNHSGAVKFELTKTSTGTFRLRRYATGGTGPEDVWSVLNANSNVTFIADVIAVSFESTSARKLKENFRPLPSRDIMALQPQMYDRKDGRKDDELGLILEEVQAVYPELCSDTGIDYSRLAVVLLQEVQELKRTLH